MKTNKTLKKRIKDGVIIDKKTKCWEWQKYVSEKGYGIIKVDSKVKKAHRISYEAFNEVELGLETIHHLCHNRKCVNPKHLIPITQRENALEMWERKFYLKTIEKLENKIIKLEEQIEKRK